MFTSIGRFIVPTFSLYLTLAIVAAGAVCVFRLRERVPLRPLVNCLLAALVLGVAFARVEYVLLNGDVFAGRLVDALTRRPGGLDWHGAFLGALLGLVIAARVQRVDVPVLLDACTPALPMLAFAGWTACRWIGCVYGTEVQTLAFYPAWTVTEGRDIFGIIAPRYDTHRFGQALGWLLLVLTAVMWLWGLLAKRPAARFWTVAVLFCAGMLAIGFFRADYAPTLGGIRADRYLDTVLLMGTVVMLVRSLTRPQNTGTGV